MARRLLGATSVAWPRLLIASAAALLIALFASHSSQAQNPPPLPDFTTAFGQVQLDGSNISPSEQTVIAFVNGRACGFGASEVASNDPDNTTDVGKTVYVVDVRADGSGVFQLPGCGTQNDAISFYFPESGRMAVEETTFTGPPAGFVRVDLSLDIALSHRLSAQLTASDGIVN